MDPRIERAQALIRNIPDFPKPGIQFKDITPLLGDPQGLRDVIDLLAEQVPEGIDAVCGVESRGFIFGTPLATTLGVGFVPLRKPGKLPGTVIEQTFDLEYGSSTLAIHADALAAGDRVVLVDDLLATGGTLVAAHRLITRLGASVERAMVVIELGDLPGRTMCEEAGLAEVFSLFSLD